MVQLRSQRILLTTLVIWLGQITCDTKIDLCLTSKPEIEIQNCNGNTHQMIMNDTHWIDKGTGNEPDMICNEGKYIKPTKRVRDTINGYMRTTFTQKAGTLGLENTLNPIIMGYYAKSKIHIYTSSRGRLCLECTGWVKYTIVETPGDMFISATKSTEHKFCIARKVSDISRTHWAIETENPVSVFSALANTEIEYTCSSETDANTILANTRWNSYTTKDTYVKIQI
eukprot:326401_1